MITLRTEDVIILRKRCDMRLRDELIARSTPFCTSLENW